MNFLDIEVILHSNNTIETDIYYKDTKADDYLPDNSAHPKHCADSLPYNLAKRIIVFVSNDTKFEMRIKELKNWLKDCNYPDVSLISHFIMQNYKVYITNYNIPFVTTYYENIDSEKVAWKIHSELSNIQSVHLSEVYKNKTAILSQKQLKNLL